MKIIEWHTTDLYKGNFTFLLFRFLDYQHIKKIIDEGGIFVSSYLRFSSEHGKYGNHYSNICFNQNKFKKNLKNYLYYSSNNPVLEESASSLDISKDDFIDYSKWSLKLYVSNEIIIQVYEKYFLLIGGRVSGDYTWKYFKQPLTFNFIKNKVLVEGSSYRSIMCNSEFSMEINQRLWLYLYKNALGIYTNYNDYNIKTESYPNIDNSMRFIEVFKDELDWVAIQYLYPISFTKEFLYKYRDYLVFHNYVMMLHEGKVVFDHGCDYLLQKMEIIKDGIMEKPLISSYSNRKGKEFNGCNTTNSIFDYSDNICISESDRVIWSSELLMKLKDYFSWYMLSRNMNLPWSFELLIAFKDKWDFEGLSSNSAIRWTLDAIKEFKNELCFERLSSNTNVDWINAPYLYSSKKWNWNEISNNAGIDEVFVMKWQKNIILADSREGSNWKDAYIGYVNSSNYRDKRYMKPKLSLSTNEGLIWTDSLIQTFVNKLDFWAIALMGKIDSKLIMKYAGFFNESREISTYHQKNSDYPSIKVHVFSSGWQNLNKNPNFIPSEEFIDFSKKYITRIYKPYNDDTGPYHKIKGFVDPHEYSSFEEVSVYSIIKNKIS